MTLFETLTIFLGALDGIPEEADVQFQKFSYINTENISSETQ